MFDARLRPLIDPPLDRMGRALAARGVGADAVTVVACLAGLAAAGAIVFQAYVAALVLFLAGRLLDGLDGAVARATQGTDRGGLLDIVLDYVVYAAIPLAFAFAAPQHNAVAAAALLAAIVVNGIAFLAFAAVAARRGLETTAQGRKSIYYLGGLTEGAETIAVYAAWCVWPGSFALLATLFAVAVLLSGAARVVTAWHALA